MGFAGAQPGERQHKSKGQTLLQQLRERSQSCRDKADCSSAWGAVAGQRLRHLRHSVAQSLFGDRDRLFLERVKALIMKRPLKG